MPWTFIDIVNRFCGGDITEGKLTIIVYKSFLQP